MSSLPDHAVVGEPLYQAVRGLVVERSPQVPGYGAMILPGYDEGADFVLVEESK